MKASVGKSNLRAGDLVTVRTPNEILKTLDSDGSLDGLPFMPEMLEHCGKHFRVFNRVVQSTIDAAFLGSQAESYVREFKNNDVVTLRGIRCSGAQHDGCQRGCSIFWKEAWLRRPDESDQHDMAPQASCCNVPPGPEPLLKAKTEAGRYYCQSSEFPKATLHLSGAKRIRKCFSAVAAGNISAGGMVKRIATWMWWKTYRRLIGEPARGKLDKTPACSLGLKAGELVEIKSRAEIIETLNAHGRNRGLHFSADQLPFCGGRYRVRGRTDKIIAEGTGEMKNFRDTVTLEDVLCDSACFAFGGCYRSDLLYWREIWLKRVEDGNSQHSEEQIERILRT